MNPGVIVRPWMCKIKIFIYIEVGYWKKGDLKQFIPF